jgi:rod shape-determining protein MreC
LFLQLISLSILVSNNNFHQNKFLKSSGNITGYVLEKKNNIEQYFLLKKINEDLIKENEYLKNKLIENYYPEDTSLVPIYDTLKKQQYYYIAAKVISNTVNTQDNYLTLNKGSIAGIKPDMGIIWNEAIVGFIKDVSEHYSTAISVLNKNFVLSVKLKSTNDHGLIKWEGKDKTIVSLTGITADVPVKVGDTVITRGASARFPEGKLVGIVSEIKQNPGSMYHIINVKLFTNFSSVYNVYVIDNRYAEEQLKLEEKLNSPE